MRQGLIPVTPSLQFHHLVEARCGERVLRCNQCGKCTAGCPAAHFMDWGPRRIMRAIQLGLKGEALSSPTIWLCLFCYTCSARCPLGLDIPKVMECLRLLAQEGGIKPAVRGVEIIHRLFLGQIKRLGRIYELGLAGGYSLSTRRLPYQVSFLPGMISRGKLAFLPRFKGASAKAIFSKVKEIEGG